MNRRSQSFAVLVTLCTVTAQAGQELPPMSAQGRPAIVSVAPNRTSVGRFEKFELSVDLSATYENPFDPDQVDLVAEFVGPSGKQVDVPGFFYQAYRNRRGADDSQRPLLDAVGNPSWKVRFAPTELGDYQYRLRLENRIGERKEQVAWGPGRFACVASANHGFLRVSPQNHRYFQFDDGTSFFAVGQNLQNDWPCYSHYRPLAAAGCNAVRVWTFCHWTWLEWTFNADLSWAKQGDWMRSYAGLGRYNPRIAWIADQQLERSERDGLRLMFCLGNATGGGELSKKGRGGYGSWAGHPYNHANGGFLSEPEQFWTDPRALKLYKQRLRYVIARYGYSPNVWAWEFWNELGDARPEIVAWHREMGNYVRELDPNRHLVTTSTWQSPDRFRAMWNLTQMDFTQTHNYGSAAAIQRVAAQVLREFRLKPHVVGEGGGPPSGRDPKHGQTAPLRDPENIEFHNALWAGAMSGAAGATLPWWWSDRVEPGNLFFHYAAVARFTRDEPWATLKLSPAEPPCVRSTRPGRFSPVLVAPTSGVWGERPPRNQFTVASDGNVTHMNLFPATLFGRRRSEWSNPPRLAVDYPIDGQLAVRVERASGGTLEIALDGQTVLHEPIVADRNHDVAKSFAIQVPAGRHQIELRNVGPDWLRMEHILLTNYRDTAKHPDVDLYAVQSDRAAYLWVHHRLNTLGYREAGFAAEPIAGVKATVSGLADGRYRIEWWDTHEGRITHTAASASRSGRLDLDLPEIRTDLACKIKPE
jgi:hypothetical protein